MTLHLNGMGTPKTKSPRIEEGTYMARIVAIIDLGLQAQTDWQTGEPSESKKRVLITWELPTERISITDEDGEVEDLPRWISKEYTLSNYEQSNLMKLLSGLAPDIKDLQELLDRQCMISVGSTSGGNAKVTGVVKPPMGMDVPPLENDSSYFDFDSPDEDLFKSQIGWIRQKVMDAENYTGFADQWV